MSRRIAGLLFILCCWLLPAQVAQAHAVMIGSSPDHRSVHTTPPTMVEMRFNEPVRAEFTPLMVRNQEGEPVTAEPAVVDPLNPTIVRARLQPLQNGFYTAVYRVVSLDGHVVSGTVAFTVGPPLENVPDIEEAEIPAFGVPTSVGLTKGVSQWLAVTLAGLTAFLVLAWYPVAGSPSARTVGVWAIGLAALLLATGLIELGLYAVRASGEPFSLNLMWQAITRTRAGLIWIARAGFTILSGLALTLAHLARPGFLRGVTLLPGALLLLTYTLQSHAMALQQTLPLMADWLHLLGLAPWAGGLVGLGLVVWPSLRERAPEEQTSLLRLAVPRFSILATAAVLILIVTGVYAAWLHIPSWEALYTTNYGWMLLIKLILFVPLLLLGGYNFIKRGAGPLRKAVLAEVLIMATMFGTVGFLTSLPPAETEIATRRGPFLGTATTQGLTITLEIAPNQIGYNRGVVTLRNAAGAPEAGASVGFRLDMEAMDMGPVQSVDAAEIAPGVHQSAQDLILGMPGEWQVDVVVLTKIGREVRQRFTVNVPPPIGY